MQNFTLIMIIGLTMIGILYRYLKLWDMKTKEQAAAKKALREAAKTGRPELKTKRGKAADLDPLALFKKKKAEKTYAAKKITAKERDRILREKSQGKIKDIQKLKKKPIIADKAPENEGFSPLSTDAFGNPIVPEYEGQSLALAGDNDVHLVAPSASGDQIIAGKIRAESIAAIFFGDDAKHDVAELLGTILGMREQGLSDRQIARILAGTRLINPSVDYELLAEVIDLYEKVMHECGIEAEYARYNMQKKRYHPELSASQMLEQLQSGDLGKLEAFFLDYAKFNIKEAGGLPAGYLSDKFLGTAAASLSMNAAMIHPFDAEGAKTLLNYAATLSDKDATAYLVAGRIELLSGDLTSAAKSFGYIKDNMKSSEEAYGVATAALTEIEKKNVFLQNDSNFSIYSTAVERARMEVRASIHGFMSTHDYTNMVKS